MELPLFTKRINIISHALKRTSPKGGEFVGYCVKCGEKLLPFSSAQDDCPFDDQVSDAQALVKIIKTKK